MLAVRFEEGPVEDGWDATIDGQTFRFGIRVADGES